MKSVGYVVAGAVVATSLAGAVTTAGAAPVRPAVALASVPAVIGSLEVPPLAAALAVSADDTVYVSGYIRDDSMGLLTAVPSGTVAGSFVGRPIWQDDSAFTPINLDVRDDTILITGWQVGGVQFVDAQRNLQFSILDDTIQPGTQFDTSDIIGVSPALAADGCSAVYPNVLDDSVLFEQCGGVGGYPTTGVVTTAAAITADDTVFLTGDDSVVSFNLDDTQTVTPLASVARCGGAELFVLTFYLDIALLDDSVYYLSNCSGISAGSTTLGSLNAITGLPGSSVNIGSFFPLRIRAGVNRLLLPSVSTVTNSALLIVEPDGALTSVHSPDYANFADAVETSTGLVYASYYASETEVAHVAVIDGVTSTTVTETGVEGDPVSVTLSTATGNAWFNEMVEGVSIGGVGARYTRSGDTLQITAPSMGACTIVAPLRCQAQVTVNLLGGNALDVGTFTYALPPIPAGPPEKVVGQAGDRLVQVTWSAPTSSGSYPITYYRAEVSPGGATCLVQSESCTVTGLTNGTAYTVRVQALTGAGWGAWSSPSATFTPQPTPVAESIVITGSRGEVRGRSGVIVAGTSTGMVGRSLTPMVKFPGQTSYTAGEARPVVSASGSFTWERRTGKKVYVYFMASDDVRSNRVVIAAK